jgi:phosphatidate cytidylyltransferase
MLSLREHASDRRSGRSLVRGGQALDEGAAASTSWVMAIGVLDGLGLGRAVATVLFAIVALFCAARVHHAVAHAAGRPPQPGAGVLCGAAAAVLAGGQPHFDLFTVFIPVYVFLALPVVSALANDPERFLERNAKLQWGIMVCVYGMSHVPALLLLDFPATAKRARFWCSSWCLWCRPACWCSTWWGALSAQAGGAPGEPELSVDQLAGRRGRRQAVRAGCCPFITPFKPGQALGMALLACVAGSLGHLVMKALKRDRGVTSWGMQGMSVTGAGGLLDRVDALCFAAPVFFHSVRWYFGA